MVDAASTAIAAISLFGTLLIALLNFGYAWGTDKRKRYIESQNLIAKYRDPLLLAAQDLQSRLYSLVQGDLYHWIGKVNESSESTDEKYKDLRKDQKENLRLYTAFLVGQFLSWTYILRRQAQYISFTSSPEEDNKRLVKILARISQTFSTDDPQRGLKEASFTLWRGQQIGIGEVMTELQAEPCCMGYASFVHTYKDAGAADRSGVIWELERGCTGGRRSVGEPPAGARLSGDEFRKWFRPIIESTNRISAARCDKEAGEQNEIDVSKEDRRVRMLQHLLLDLIRVLDVNSAVMETPPEQSSIQSTNTQNMKKSTIWKKPNRECNKAPNCPCTQCDPEGSNPSASWKVVSRMSKFLKYGTRGSKDPTSGSMA
jgi:hypothetical protein